MAHYRRDDRCTLGLAPELQGDTRKKYSRIRAIGFFRVLPFVHYLKVANES
jgi:hypothetical protein